MEFGIWFEDGEWYTVDLHYEETPTGIRGEVWTDGDEYLADVEEVAAGGDNLFAYFYSEAVATVQDVIQERFPRCKHELSFYSR